jgi:O-methyltransferase involved in polyketide biosynthesis
MDVIQMGNADRRLDPMHKLSADSLVGVSETLLVPLHYRVQNSRAGDSGFKDEMAERFHDAIDYDWSKFQGQLFQGRGIAIRTQILDEQVKIFIAQHPDGLIVNLGCGLDTRFYRLDNGTIVWLEIDLPDVIAFREKLDEQRSPRHVLLARSILDEAWTNDVRQFTGRPILFVAEGLLPYFTEAQHKLVFGYLAGHFPGQQMLFQTSAPSLTRDLIPSSDLAKLRTSAELQWGLEDSAQISALDPRIHLLDDFPLLAGREHELPQELRQRWSPEQLRRVATIVHVRFD